MKSVNQPIVLAAVALTAVIAFLFFGKTSRIFIMDAITLKTADNKNLAANLFQAANPKGWLILIHMMPATKESWTDFAKEIKEFGYESLAIDLRGHGQSDGGPDGYQNFTDAEHQASIQDLEAAWNYLKSKGALADKTMVIGASIGANLGLQFLTSHPEIEGGILLSPGDYKGINSGLLVKKLSPGQKILFVASRQDERSGGDNAAQNQKYYNLASQVKNRHLILFDGAGHGTELLQLQEEFDLKSAIIKFLEKGNIN